MTTLNIGRGARGTVVAAAGAPVGRGRAWRVWLVLFLAAGIAVTRAAELTPLLQQGLLEEEGNRNYEAAIKAYSQLADQFSRDRALAATAVFRLGECQRKLGRTNEAAVAYRRVLSEFPAEDALVILSRQNLAGLGLAAPAGAPRATAPRAGKNSRAEQLRLFDEEIRAMEEELKDLEKRVGMGLMPASSTLSVRRELLSLRRQRAALDDEPAAPEVVADDSTARRALLERELVTASLEAKSLLEESARLRDEKPRMAWQQVLNRHSNPVFVELMKQLSQTEQNLAQAEQTYGPGHVQRKTLEAASRQIQQQLAEQVDGVARSLRDQAAQAEQKAARLAQELDQLGRPRTVAAASPGTGAAAGASEVPAPESREIARLEAMLANSPDLLNAPDKDGSAPLHAAALAGQTEVVRFLIQRGADLELRATGDKSFVAGRTALQIAAESGHKAVVEQLLRAGARVDAVRSDGSTALHLAAGRGHRSVVETLLKAGANPNIVVSARLGNPNTPLHWAIGAGRTNVVDLLLSRGVDPNGPTNSNPTPLLLAVDGGRTDAALMLLARGARPDAGSNSRGDAPLISAASRGDERLVLALLASNASPASANQEQMTALHYAAGVGRLELVQALLKAGAPVSALDRNGQTPLFNAAIGGSTGCVAVLLQAGATARVRRHSDGLSPLGVLMNMSQPPADRTQLVRQLVAAGADVMAPFGDRPLLRYGIELGNPDLVEALLTAPIRLDGTNAQYKWLLWLPYQNAGTEGSVAGFARCIDLLVRAGADPNTAGIDGLTPLFRAVENRQRPVVEALLRGGANPNVVSADGSTPASWLLGAANASSPGVPGGGVSMIPSPTRRMVLPSPGVPGGNGGGLSSAPATRATPEELLDLLVKAGADPKLHLRQRILLGRGTSEWVIFTASRDGQRVNQFTLLEVLARCQTHNGWPGGQPLAFPDWQRVSRHRLTVPAGEVNPVVINALQIITNSALPDPLVSWGDTIEVPELDHPSQMRWSGLNSLHGGLRAEFQKRLRRTVFIVIKGQTNPVVLTPRLDESFFPAVPGGPVAPGAPGAAATSAPPQITRSVPDFWVNTVLLDSGLIRVSSDLSRVQVRRARPGRDLAPVVQVDAEVFSQTSGSTPVGLGYIPIPSTPRIPRNVWLQDGDVIEVPEKP